MKKIITILLFCIFLINCSARMTSPPKTDLSQLKKIGIVTFSVKNAKGVLDDMATDFLRRQLREYYRNSELIILPDLLKIFSDAVERGNINETVKKISSEHGLDALFIGEISVSDFIPDMKVQSLMQRSRIRMKFRMNAVLKLYSGNSGSDIWNGSSSNVGYASYDHFARNINPVFYVSDNDESYVRFVRKLIYFLTEDLRPGRK